MENDSNLTPQAPAAAPPEPAFVVEYVLSEELYVMYNQVNMKANGIKKRFLIYGVLALALGLLNVLLAVFIVDRRNLLLGIIMMLLGAFLVVYLPFSPRISSRALLKTAKGMVGRSHSLCLYADRLTEYTSRSQLTTYYGELYKVVESDELVLLYINKIQAHILDKSGFRKGTPEALTAYLRGTWHVPYKRVK